MAAKSEKRDRALGAIAKLIADNLPKDVLEEAVDEGVREALREFKVNGWECRRLLEMEVAAKTTELLRTRYASEIEAMATEAALKIVRRNS